MIARRSRFRAFPFAACAALALAAPGPARAGAAATGGAESLVGGDAVHVFSASGTFVVSKPVTARILVVGGGGAGGYGYGGGGGGGAVVDTNEVALAAGTYDVVVGAGGSPNDSLRAVGYRGGASSVSLGGTALVSALGGGGGAGGNTGAGTADAGTGGGSTANAGNSAGLQGGRGGAGGNKTYSAHSGNAAGGGGGAGGDGEDGDNTVGVWGGSAWTAPCQSGAGGPGVESDITGVSRTYGGGGGGGAGGGTTPTGGAGRDGGGDGPAVGSETPAGAGEDGRGGGGGGGGNKDANRSGGRGGSGLVVIRYALSQATISADAPVILSATSVRLSGALALPGGGTARLFLGIGADPDALSWRILDEAAAAGPFAKTATGLAMETVYHFAFRAETDGGTVETPVATFTTPSNRANVVATGSGAERYRVGDDIVLRIPADATLSVKAGPDGAVPKLRVLLVGGGGAGGWSYAGGGGGGGFVERSDFELPVGDYLVSVGAGGAKATSSKAPGSGGDTAIWAWTSATEAATNLVARGGGAGGSGTTYQQAGFAGGCGGGGAMWGGGGAGSQGGDGGGGSTANGGNVAGGGGGAGARGQDGDISAGVKTDGVWTVPCRSGAGGDGLPSDITGEEVWYAGGGGGGAGGGTTPTGGAGGRGGGGTGPVVASNDPTGMDGEDGLGGGGAGGGNKDLTRAGGRGGSGIAIIRFADIHPRATIIVVR